MAVYAAGAVLDLYRIQRDLRAGEARIDQLDLDTVRREGIEAVIDDAARDLDRAAARAADSPFMRVLSPVPIVGDQVDALRDVTAAIDRLGEEAMVTGRRLSESLDAAGEGPEARLGVFTTVLDELDRIEAVAAGIDVGANGRLLPPVAAARSRVERALADVPARFEPLRDDVRAVRDLLAGPSTYMVLLGNNAEMRSHAMPLTAAQAHINRADIELDNVTAAGKRILITTSDGGLNAGPELETVRDPYPEWLVGTNILATSVVPNFPVTAPLYAGIAESAEGWTSDGVLFLDVIGLADLLEVVGPVTIDGVEYSADTAPQLLLNENYLEFDTPEEAEARRDAQAEIALGLFDAINERQVDVLDLVSALQRSAAGRHFMAWSSDERLQTMFESLAVSGRVLPSDTLVTFQNTAANKLDWYLEPEVDIDVRALQSGEWEVTITGTLHNPDGIETSAYIDGAQVQNGAHRTMFALYLPWDAGAPTIENARITERGFDGTNQVVGARFLVPRGETTTMTARYRLAGHHAGIRVIPSARTHGVTWTHDGATYDDDRPFFVGFGSFPPSVEEQRRKSFATVGAILMLAGLLLQFRQLSRAGSGAGWTRVDGITTGALVALGLILASVPVVF